MEEKHINPVGEAENSELPWLIFTLNGNAYAVNSKYVNGIEMLPDVITPLPYSPDIYRGLVERRGEVYPLLDMRRVFKFPSIDDETAAFKEMMEQRKNDHTKWIKALDNCVKTGEKFSLATDPHKCAFGIWYDNFSTDSHSAGMHLKKVEEPHRLLHESAPIILEAVHNGDTEKAERLMKKLWEDYYPNVIAVLDNAENVYRSTFREIVVVLADGEQMMGLLVDEVLAVDKIEPVNGSNKINLLMQSKYFDSTARSDKVDLEILIINENELFKLSNVDAYKHN